MFRNLVGAAIVYGIFYVGKLHGRIEERDRQKKREDARSRYSQYYYGRCSNDSYSRR